MTISYNKSWSYAGKEAWGIDPVIRDGGGTTISTETGCSGSPYGFKSRLEGGKSTLEELIGAAQAALIRWHFPEQRGGG